MHFTPSSASWLNMVERFFHDITTERLRRDPGREREEDQKGCGDWVDRGASGV